jgi:hypothetical protein
MKRQICWRTGWWVLLGALTAACGAAPAPQVAQVAQTPQMVASFPVVSSAGNSTAADPDGPVVVETVYLELEVYDPDDAAREAARLAGGYGGYETDRYGWYADGGRAVSQEILVPFDQADAFRSRLLQLGWARSESAVRHPEGDDSPWHCWTQFSIRYVSAERPVVVWRDSPFHLFALAVCGFVVQVAAFLAELAAALLLAALVVIPCVWMAVGAVTTIRWLGKKGR